MTSRTATWTSVLSAIAALALMHVRGARSELAALFLACTLSFPQSGVAPARRGVIGVLFHHVREIAQVVEQQVHGPFSLGIAAQLVNQIQYDILDFRTLDFERQRKGTGKRDPLVGFAVGSSQASAQVVQPSRVQVARDAQGSATSPLQQSGNQGEGAKMARLMLGHVEPKRPYFLGLRKRALELTVQLHGLAL